MGKSSIVYEKIGTKTEPINFSFPPSINENDADALSNEKYRAVLSFNPIKADAATVGSLIGKDNLLSEILRGEIDSWEKFKEVYNQNLNSEVKKRNLPNKQAAEDIVAASEKEFKAVKTNLVARRTRENTTLRGRHIDDIGMPLNKYVHLYMPMNIQQNESVVAGPEQLGIAGGMVQATLQGAAANQTSVVDIAKTAYKGTVTGMGELMRGQASGEFGSLIAQRLVSKLSTNVGNAVSLGSRIAINPNTRALFKQVNIREWNFVFQLIPTSPYESQLIENIIDFFRMEQLPTELVSEGTTTGLAYRFPNLMHIKALYRNESDGRYKPILTRFLPAYLQSVDVTYNTTGMSFYQGGKFHDATMNLKFIEYRPLNKDDIHVERAYLGKTSLEAPKETI
jgi:hypothetical protein